MKIVVLDGIVANPGDLSWNDIKGLGDLTIYDRSTSLEVYDKAKEADIIICNKVPLNSEVLEKLPKLKMIALLSTGYNVVDIDYAIKNNIVVCNVPAYSSESVAQLTFAFILELAMGVGKHSREVKSGDWTKCQDFCFWSQKIIELKGKSIGLIGCGSIGLNVAKVANAFGMNVFAYIRHEKILPDYINKVSLDDMCDCCDYISVHCPLNDESNGLVNKNLIDKMKDGVVVINTARGAIVNELDMANALNSGKVGGYGADVLSSEPPKGDNPLLSAKNCYITPHIAWASIEARQRLLHQVYLNIKGFIEGNVINSVY